MNATRLSVCVLGFAAMLSAHGGQYRGVRLPTANPVPPPPRNAPPGLTPAPRPGVPGVTPGTGIPLDASSTTHWQVWWEFNKDPFLQSRGVAQSGPETGSDDFYLGVRRAIDRVDTLAPTDEDREQLIVPALAKLLEEERNRDVQSACLVALGKIGRDGPGVDLERLLASRIARDDQEVRETAVLSLGIAGRTQALPVLASLVRDDADGRRLEERSKVSDRTRAFAAYGLGLLAMRSQDPTFDQDVQKLLLAVLQDKEQKDRDLRTAAVTGLGILGCDAPAASQKLLLWRTVEALLEWFDADQGKGDELVQAHAPVAIARLLGRGNSSLHQRCKRHFADLLMERKRRSNPILQSSAIALGMLAEPVSDDEEVIAALKHFYENGHDRLARSLCAISLGRIGGTEQRTWLLRAYERGNKTIERPWVALGLGLWCEGAPDELGLDATIAQRLLDDLESSPNRDTQAALAVAVGLVGHPLAVPPMTRMLRDHEGEEQTAGYFAVSLGLLGDRSAVPLLTAVLDRSQRRPFLLQQTAVALGMLGDRNANEQLLAMMARSESIAVLSALARAIGQIGDRRSIQPLRAMLEDRESAKLVRAFVAAALGGVGDKDLLPWNLPLSVDCNYATDMDTLTNGSTGVLDIL